MKICLLKILNMQQFYQFIAFVIACLALLRKPHALRCCVSSGRSVGIFDLLEFAMVLFEVASSFLNCEILNFLLGMELELVLELVPGQGSVALVVAKI